MPGAALFLVVLLVLSCAPLTPAFASDGSDTPAREGAAALPHAPLPHWAGSADLIAEYNPRGIDLSGGIDYHAPYRYDKSGDEASSWEAGTGIDLTPAYAQQSAYFEWSPFLFVTGRLEYDGYYYFGTNGGSLSFSTPQAAFGDPELRARQGTEDSGAGSRLLFQSTLQAKAGDIVLRNQTDIARYRFPGPGPYYLVQEYDTLLPNGGSLVANRTQLLKELDSAGGKVFFGPYYEFVRGASGTRERRQIGLLLYSEQKDAAGNERERHYVAQIGYDLTDQNRQGQVFVLVGLGFSSPL